MTTVPIDNIPLPSGLTAEAAIQILYEEIPRRGMGQANFNFEDGIGNFLEIEEITHASVFWQKATYQRTYTIWQDKGLLYGRKEDKSPFWTYFWIGLPIAAALLFLGLTFLDGHPGEIKGYKMGKAILTLVLGMYVLARRFLQKPKSVETFYNILAEARVTM